MEDSSITEERHRLLRKRKIFLLFTKYLSHILGFGYIIYTLLGFFGIDAVEIGYLVQLSILPWCYAFSASKALEFCYVHRLPLYYIVINDLLNITDYYIGIPIDVKSFLVLHLLVIFTFMSLYIYSYVKNIKKSFRIVN